MTEELFRPSSLKPLYDKRMIAEHLAKVEQHVVLGAEYAVFASSVPYRRMYGFPSVNSAGGYDWLGGGTQDAVHKVLSDFSKQRKIGREFSAELEMIDGILRSGRVDSQTSRVNAWRYAHPIYEIPLLLRSWVDPRIGSTALETITWSIAKTSETDLALEISRRRNG